MASFDEVRQRVGGIHECSRHARVFADQCYSGTHYGINSRSGRLIEEHAMTTWQSAEEPKLQVARLSDITYFKLMDPQKLVHRYFVKAGFVDLTKFGFW